MLALFSVVEWFLAFVFSLLAKNVQQSDAIRESLYPFHRNRENCFVIKYLFSLQILDFLLDHVTFIQNWKNSPLLSCKNRVYFSFLFLFILFYYFATHSELQAE